MQQRTYTNVLFRKSMSDMTLGGKDSIRKGINWKLPGNAPVNKIISECQNRYLDLGNYY